MSAASGPIGFEVVRLLGGGGFAHVHEGRGPDGSRVALKVAIGGDRETRLRFGREAEALRRIGPPHVPELHDHGELADGRAWLAMELVPGGTLAERLRHRHEPLPLPLAGAIACAILDGIEAAHGHGFVHRDLKPENISIEESPALRVRLIDFGLALPMAEEGGSLTQAGAILGTVGYMAPEQLRGDRVGPGADLYAFGVILFELLTGRLPFTGDRATVARGHLLLRPPRPGQIAAVPPPLEALALECLAKDPAERPASAAELRVRLDEALRAEGRARAVPDPAPAARGDEAGPVVIVAVRGDVTAGELQEIVAPRGGFVARQRGSVCAAVLPAAGLEDPLDAAHAVSAELARIHRAPVAIHVANLVIRSRGASGRIAHGPALADLEAWLPREAWTGVFMTPEAARLSDDRAGAVPVVDPDGLLDRLQASATACLAGRGARLHLLVGDAGLGKSRICREIGGALERLGDGLDVVALRADHPATGDGAPTLRAIFERLGAAPPAGGPSELAAALVALARRRPTAVILDDGHRADDASLDALEAASRSAGILPLWILVAAHPGLERARPRWGTGAERIGLEPLSERGAMELARRLLEPVEHPPEETLLRLARGSGGSPGQLVELVRTLKREGIVRRYPRGSAWYVATDELDRLGPSPSSRWVAERALASLPAELRELLGLSAVLGDGHDRAEVDALLRALEERRVAAPSIDTSAGLSQLVARGLLVREGERHLFRDAALRDATYAATPQGVRLHAHRQALAYWRPRGDLHRIARHAAGAGEAAEAREAYRALAEGARREQACRDAEAWFTRALEQTPPEETQTLVELLKARGGVRRLLTRFEDARQDLGRARSLAEKLGDEAVVVELLVEEGAVCDFLHAMAESAALIEEARERAACALPARVEARLGNWLGVVRFRQQRYAEAIELLEHARGSAAALGEHETQAGSMLMLSASLRELGRVDEGEAVLAEAIELCERSGDAFHLAVALCIRLNFWRRRGKPQAGVSDLVRASEIARARGFATIESIAHQNLSALLLSAGDRAGALREARLAHESSAGRFGERPLIGASLMYGQLLALGGDRDAARRVLANVQERDAKSVPVYDIAYRSIVYCLRDASRSTWSRLIGRAHAVGGGENLGLLRALRARYGGGSDRALPRRGRPARRPLPHPGRAADREPRSSIAPS